MKSQNMSQDCVIVKYVTINLIARSGGQSMYNKIVIVQRPCKFMYLIEKQRTIKILH
jgi:hypothetical protein